MALVIANEPSPAVAEQFFNHLYSLPNRLGNGEAETAARFGNLSKQRGSLFSEFVEARLVCGVDLRLGGVIAVNPAILVVHVSIAGGES